MKLLDCRWPTALVLVMCLCGCNRNSNNAGKSTANSAAILASPAGAENPVGPTSGFEIKEYGVENGIHKWTLSGDSVGEVLVRLHYISNGQSRIASESQLKASDDETLPATVNVSLKMTDDMDTVSPVMAVSFENIEPDNSNVNDSIELQEGLAGLKRGEIITRDGFVVLDSDTPMPIFCSVFSDEDVSFSRDRFGSMIEASEAGATFVVVTVQVKSR